jgi:hypothetical protein
MISYSCKKKTEQHSCENKIDSVFTYIDSFANKSSQYIAAYPESWWKYSTGDKISCTKGDYSIFELESEDIEECQSFYSVYRFIGPYIDIIPQNPDLHFGMVNGDHNISTNKAGYKFSKYVEFIRTNYIDNLVNDSWVISSDNIASVSRSTTRKLNQFHSSFTIPSGEIFADVVEIQQNFTYTDSELMLTEMDSTLFYYAKEIGLIMVNYFNVTDTDFYLTDYYIAPH